MSEIEHGEVPQQSAFAAAADVSTKCYTNDGNPPVIDAIPPEVSTILDVGCGAGSNAKLLKARGKIVDGITLSAAEAAEASPWCRRVVVADLETGLPEAILAETYDACLCSHVLEHLRWPDKLLRQLASRLRPAANGVPQLVVALPNIMCYKTRIPLLLGQFEYEASGIMDASHFRWFTFQSGRRLIEENGFRVLRTFGIGHFPLSVLRRVLPMSVQQAIDRLAVAMRPTVFATEMIFVASRGDK